ncbi:hypothetical protein GW17_00048995 [Ensete ventricosum]|nr:hypothetical protein GW17_00048995 [Ensete ventricosum]
MSRWTTVIDVTYQLRTNSLVIQSKKQHRIIRWNAKLARCAVHRSRKENHPVTHGDKKSIRFSCMHACMNDPVSGMDDLANERSPSVVMRSWQWAGAVDDLLANEAKSG